MGYLCLLVYVLRGGTASLMIFANLNHLSIENDTEKVENNKKFQTNKNSCLLLVIITICLAYNETNSRLYCIF